MSKKATNEASDQAERQAVETLAKNEPLSVSLPKDNDLAKSRKAGVELAQSVSDAVDEIEREEPGKRDQIAIRALRDTLSDALARVNKFVTA